MRRHDILIIRPALLDSLGARGEDYAMESSHEHKIPEGLDFLRTVSEMEDSCEKVTDERLSRMGVKAPKCLEKLGTV
jgi:hypothetical protein